MKVVQSDNVKRNILTINMIDKFIKVKEFLLQKIRNRYFYYNT